MQEKHSQNNIAKEISEGIFQQFSKLFFEKLESLMELSIRKKTGGLRGWCEATNKLQTRKQLLFSEDNAFDSISAL